MADVASVAELRILLQQTRARFALLATRARAARSAVETNEVERQAAALLCHNAYTLLERLFEAIARDFNAAPPAGPAWHRELLRRMATEVPGIRPAVLSTETHDLLADLLSFRHVIRNLYVFDLRADEVGRHLELVSQVAADVDRELAALDAHLARVSSPPGGLS